MTFSLTLANDRSNAIDKIAADYEWQSLIKATPFSREAVKVQRKQGKRQLGKGLPIFCAN